MRLIDADKALHMEFEEINNTSCKQGDNWLWSTECMECGLFIEDKDKENLIKRINTRKPMERIIERLEQSRDARYFLGGWKISKNYLKGSDCAFYEAIDVVKEEGGIE